MRALFGWPRCWCAVVAHCAGGGQRSSGHVASASRSNCSWTPASAAENPPRAHGNSREAWAAHSLLPGVDSRRAHAGRPDHRNGGDEIYGGRKNDSVAAGFGGNVHVSSRDSNRREVLDVNFDFLLSAPARGIFGRRFRDGESRCPELESSVAPSRGATIRDWTFVPTLKLPTGWQFGTALPIAKQDGDPIDFQPVPLDTLVDSPVLSGRYFRTIQLTPGQDPPHEMDIAADSPAALAMLPKRSCIFISS